MDLLDGDHGQRHAPADELTAAEESAAAAAAAPGQRTYCAQCIGLLLLPHVHVRVYGAGGADALEWSVSPGPRLVEAAAAARDAGHMVSINFTNDCGVYADTTVRGTACCAAHTYVVANEGGRGFPFYL